MNLPEMWRTTPALAISALLGAILAVVSLSATIWGPRSDNSLAVVGVVVGLVMEFVSPCLHDQWHLRRGETPHAMWGNDDARRPNLLGGPRTPGNR